MTAEEERARSLSDFKNPGIWPSWPYQTIKRRKADGSMPDCALLVDFSSILASESDVHFVDALFYDLLEDKAKRVRLLDDARKSPRIDPEKLIAEGWVID